MDKMKMAQKATAAPYVVLSGKIHAGQISDAVSKYATAGLEDDAGKETVQKGIARTRRRQTGRRRWCRRRRERDGPEHAANAHRCGEGQVHDVEEVTFVVTWRFEIYNLSSITHHRPARRESSPPRCRHWPGA